MKFNIVTYLSLIIGLYNGTVFAGSTNEFINETIKQRDTIIKTVTKTHQDFKLQKNYAKQLTKYHALIESIEKQQKDNFIGNYIKKPPEGLVFISLGMPDLSIKQIMHDAEKYQMPVVIRGLHENSFRKTAEKMFNLLKEKNDGGIMINPLWFRQYCIKQVPAVVVHNKENFDVLYGNIPIKKALMIIADKGDLSKMAKSILARGSK